MKYPIYKEFKGYPGLIFRFDGLTNTETVQGPDDGIIHFGACNVGHKSKNTISHTDRSRWMDVEFDEFKNVVGFMELIKGPEYET